MLNAWNYVHDEIVLSLLELDAKQQPVRKTPTEVSREHLRDRNKLYAGNHREAMVQLVEWGVLNVQAKKDLGVRAEGFYIGGSMLAKASYALNFDKYAVLLWGFACEELLKKNKPVPEVVKESLHDFLLHSLILFSIRHARQRRAEAKANKKQYTVRPVKKLSFKTLLQFLASARLYNSEYYDELDDQQRAFVDAQRATLDKTSRKYFTKATKGRRLKSGELADASEEVSAVDNAGVLFFDELFKDEKPTTRRFQQRAQKTYSFLKAIMQELDNKKR